MFLATLPRKALWETGVKENVTSIIILLFVPTKHQKYRTVGTLNIEHTDWHKKSHHNEISKAGLYAFQLCHEQMGKCEYLCLFFMCVHKLRSLVHEDFLYCAVFVSK